MPKINVFDMRRSLQRDYAARGERLTAKEADRLLSDAFEEAAFKEWVAKIDETDLADGLIDHNPHSDSTAKRAIMRVLRAMFNQQAVAA